MYRNCIFCHGRLGGNQVLEHFPVGRRLAFDAGKGRLWVICPGCARWNLTPLEERWESIEAAERMFRDTRLRVSTENVGLARVSDGTELIQVGRPPRSELAAWRYGDMLVRRRRRYLAGTWATFLAASILVFPPVFKLFIPLIAAMPYAMFLLQTPTWLRHYVIRRRIVGKVQLDSGESAVIRGEHLPDAQLVPEESVERGERWSLVVTHDAGSATLRGSSAVWLASKVLAGLNKSGARRRDVSLAVVRMEQAAGAERLFAELAKQSAADARRGRSIWVTPLAGPDPAGKMASLPFSDRLALEMMTHDEQERQALHGELAALEAAWREAEEIAEIADALVVDPLLNARLRLLREKMESAGRIEESDD